MELYTYKKIMDIKKANAKSFKKCKLTMDKIEKLENYKITVEFIEENANTKCEWSAENYAIFCADSILFNDTIYFKKLCGVGMVLDIVVTCFDGCKTIRKFNYTEV